MLLVVLLFPSVQIQDGQRSGKDKSACPDPKVKEDGCIIPGLDRIRYGRGLLRLFRYFRRIFGKMHGLSLIVDIPVRADLMLCPILIHIVEGFKDNQGFPCKGAAI